MQTRALLNQNGAAELARKRRLHCPLLDEGLPRHVVIGAILDEMFGPELQLDGKQPAEVQRQLEAMSDRQLQTLRRRLCPSLDCAASKPEVVRRILTAIFKDLPDDRGAAPAAAAAGGDASDAATLHARDRAAKICGVSSTYIGRAKLIKQQSPELFARLKIKQLNLGQAIQELRRSVKRTSMAVVRRALPSKELGKPVDSIQTGDSLVLMPRLAGQKYRLVFADPPYNIGVDYGKGSKADRRPDEQYMHWCKAWMGNLPRLLTPDGCAWILISDEYAAEYVVAMKQTGLKMRAWIKWYETFGTNCADNFNRTSRHLLYFVRDPKRHVFNREHFTRPSARQTTYADTRANPNGKLWDDVWVINRLTGTSDERIPDFPTQLPLALIRPIIEGCTEPGDEVLDPFSGSGTTAAACAMAGRKCLGIEINATYADLSRARLARIGAKR